MNLRDELMRVRAEHGALTPANVVESAREADSPLHHRFEWDDTIAAEQYRLSQAAEIIRKVKVSYSTADNQRREVRAFLPVRGDEPTASVYEPTDEVLTDPFTSKLKLQEFEREWKSFKSRYEHLREFRAVLLADIEGQAA